MRSCTVHYISLQIYMSGVCLVTVVTKWYIWVSVASGDKLIFFYFYNNFLLIVVIVTWLHNLLYIVVQTHNVNILNIQIEQIHYTTVWGALRTEYF